MDRAPIAVRPPHHQIAVPGLAALAGSLQNRYMAAS
jgi:hypothetical protein